MPALWRTALTMTWVLIVIVLFGGGMGIHSSQYFNAASCEKVAAAWLAMNQRRTLAVRATCTEIDESEQD